MHLTKSTIQIHKSYHNAKGLSIRLFSQVTPEPPHVRSGEIESKTSLIWNNTHRHLQAGNDKPRFAPSQTCLAQINRCLSDSGSKTHTGLHKTSTSVDEDEELKLGRESSKSDPAKGTQWVEHGMCRVAKGGRVRLASWTAKGLSCFWQHRTRGDK